MAHHFAVFKKLHLDAKARFVELFVVARAQIEDLLALQKILAALVIVLFGFDIAHARSLFEFVKRDQVAGAQGSEEIGKDDEVLVDELLRREVKLVVAQVLVGYACVAAHRFESGGGEDVDIVALLGAVELGECGIVAAFRQSVVLLEDFVSIDGETKLHLRIFTAHTLGLTGCKEDFHCHLVRIFAILYPKSEAVMVQIYTGDGKGKTTAAAGVALRSLAAGKRVAFFQFMKAWPSGEVQMLQRLGALVDRSWDGSFIYDAPTARQKRLVRSQYERIFRLYEKGFDLVILDEILVTIHFSILSEEDILRLVEAKPKECELILTGRGATPALIAAADLVTEMRKIKHYFDQGVPARRGIEY